MLDSRRNLALACALSALAGYVDGIGFLHLGGLFVSFMSGNSTRLGVSLAASDWTGATQALVLVALFVVGAAAGSLIVLGRGHGRHRQALVLLAEGSLLAAAALAYAFAMPISRSPRSCWRWEWKTPCSRFMAAAGSASPT